MESYRSGFPVLRTFSFAGGLRRDSLEVFHRETVPVMPVQFDGNASCGDCEGCWGLEGRLADGLRG